MKRISRQAAWIAAVTLVVCGVGAWHSYVAQSRFDQVQIEAEKVADGIYMLKGAGGNLGVSVGEDGVVLIDDQFAELAGKIRAAIKELGGDAPAYLLNTHYHGDHTGGNEEFSATTTIMAHENVRLRLVSGHQPFDGESKPAPAAALPVVTYKDGLTIHFNGEEIQVVHYPAGHTDGDSIVFFKNADVVHMGDDMFAGTFPFVDLSAGGSVQGLIGNVQAVLDRIGPETRLIPGHGPLSTKKDLEAYLGMLQKTMAMVKEQMDAGRSLEQIKEKGFPEEWDSWGAGFIKADRWLETLYNSLKNDA